ncbi:hypothetical protein BH11MYX4_BH11MYX4_57040 [soil metagenome]
MQSSTIRSPGPRASSIPTLTLILYAVPSDVGRECEELAHELHLARAEVKHLQAACAALKTHRRALLIASVAIRPWDRESVAEHAARAGTTVNWVGHEQAADDLERSIRSWAAESTRRARTGR